MTVIINLVTLGYCQMWPVHVALVEKSLPTSEISELLWLNNIINTVCFFFLSKSWFECDVALVKGTLLCSKVRKTTPKQLLFRCPNAANFRSYDSATVQDRMVFHQSIQEIKQIEDARARREVLKINIWRTSLVRTFEVAKMPGCWFFYVVLEDQDVNVINALHCCITGGWWFL